MSKKSKKEYPISDYMDKLFDGHDLESCVQAIEKMSWDIQFKWELVKKLINKHGNDMFDLETFVHCEEETFRRNET